MKPLKRVLMLGLLLFTCVLPASGQRHYRFTSLSGPYDGWPYTTWSFVDGMNNQGQVIGQLFFYNDNSGNPFWFNACVWDNGQFYVLPDYASSQPTQGWSVPFAINDAGQIVGSGGTTDPNTGYCSIWQNGAISRLNPGNYTDIGPYKINNAGQMLCSEIGADHYLIRTCLMQNGVVTDFGDFGTDPAGRRYVQANALNDAGQVVFDAIIFDANHFGSPKHAFLWDNGVLTDLSGFQTTGNVEGSSATGINASGQVIGCSSFPPDVNGNSSVASFLYDHGKVTNLGYLAQDGTGFYNTQAKFINNLGDVVGIGEVWDVSASNSSPIFNWHQGAIYDVSKLVPPSLDFWFDDIKGFNDQGQITGNGNSADKLPTGYLLTPIAGSDFNGDGNADLVWQNQNSGDVATWTMNGATPVAGVSLAGSVGTEWKAVAAPDLKLDGNAGLLWRNMQTGALAFWHLKGTAFADAEVIAASVPLEWNLVGTGAFHKAGDTDLVWQDTKTGAVAVWIMNGTKVTTAAMISGGLDVNWQVVGVADLDGDGQDDLLFQNRVTGDVAYWKMNGTTFVKGDMIATGVPLDWQVGGFGDLNNDGYADIVWHNRATGDVYAWLMQGTTVKQGLPVASGVGTDWKLVGPR